MIIKKIFNKKFTHPLNIYKRVDTLERDYKYISEKTVNGFNYYHREIGSQYLYINQKINELEKKINELKTIIKKSND